MKLKDIKPFIMEFKKLELNNLEDILEMEEKMYWQGKEWQKLWQKEARNKFKELIKDYLINYPNGCWGLFNTTGELLAAVIFTRLNKVKAIPYFHRFSNYFETAGKIIYVQVFAVKNSESEENLAEKIYEQLERVAKHIGGQKVAVLIYSSFLEEKILNKLGYKIEYNNLQWEIYPDKFVNCKIYTRTVDQ